MPSSIIILASDPGVGCVAEADREREIEGVRQGRLADSGARFLAWSSEDEPRTRRALRWQCVVQVEV
jgi:hypothetical protein